MRAVELLRRVFVWKVALLLRENAHVARGVTSVHTSSHSISRERLYHLGV